MNGVIIVDKPAGWTSHDVVNRMRRILGQRSVGHLGTLDPLATGVLPLVTGSLTRLAQFYTASEKTYEGVIRFGFATNTYDADGEPAKRPAPRHPQPRASPEASRRISRHNRASPATILGQENPRRPSLQTGKKAKRGSPEAGPGGDQGIRHPRSRRRPRPLPGPCILRNLHAFRSPRNGPAPRLRSPSRIPPPHRRSRIRYQASPHPRRNRRTIKRGSNYELSFRRGASLSRREREAEWRNLLVRTVAILWTSLPARGSRQG